MIRRLTSTSFLVPTVIIATVYTILVVYLMNSTLVVDTVTGAYPILYKIRLLTALLEGMWTTMTRFGLLLLVGAALLTGANLTLTIQKIHRLRSMGRLHFAVGGGSILGVIGGGCAACGLPIVSLLGLSGSIIYLPLQGKELSIIGVILLSMSLYFMIKGIKPERSCLITLGSKNII